MTTERATDEQRRAALPLLEPLNLTRHQKIFAMGMAAAEYRRLLAGEVSPQAFVEEATERYRHLVVEYAERNGTPRAAPGEGGDHILFGYRFTGREELRALVCSASLGPGQRARVDAWSAKRLADWRQKVREQIRSTPLTPEQQARFQGWERRRVKS
jgi:hypothetical protein